MIGLQQPLWDPQYRYLAAVDPGLKSGAVFFDLIEKVLLIGEADMDALPELLDLFYLQGSFAQLAIERWALYPGAGKNLTFSDMEGPEMIGVVRFWCRLHRVEMTRIWATHRKPFLDNVPKTIKGAHRRDAIAIGLCFLKRVTGYEPDLNSFTIKNVLMGAGGCTIIKEKNNRGASGKADGS